MRRFVTLTLVSGKGGTGKTFVATNVAVALAQLGIDTLLIDADLEMPDVAITLGMEGKTPTLSDALAGNARIDEAIYEGPGGVKVLPAAVPLSAYEHVDPERLDVILLDIYDKELAELVIIDAPSGLDRDVVRILNVCKSALMVITPDLTAISDSLRVRDALELTRTKCLGVVVNMVRGEPGEVSKDEIEATLGYPVVAEILEDRRVRESIALGEPIVLSYPDSPISITLRSLAMRIAQAEGFLGF